MYFSIAKCRANVLKKGYKIPLAYIVILLVISVHPHIMEFNASVTSRVLQSVVFLLVSGKTPCTMGALKAKRMPLHSVLYSDPLFSCITNEILLGVVSFPFIAPQMIFISIFNVVSFYKDKIKRRKLDEDLDILHGVGEMFHGTWVKYRVITTWKRVIMRAIFNSSNHLFMILGPRLESSCPAFSHLERLWGKTGLLLGCVSFRALLKQSPASPICKLGGKEEGTVREQGRKRQEKGKCHVYGAFRVNSGSKVGCLLPIIRKSRTIPESHSFFSPFRGES